MKDRTMKATILILLAASAAVIATMPPGENKNATLAFAVVAVPFLVLCLHEIFS